MLIAMVHSGQKKVLFLQIRRWKLTHPHKRMCIRVYIFNFKKQLNMQKKQKKNKKKQEYKKATETIEETRIFPENRFKKVNLRTPGWRFSSSLAFPKTRVIFFGLRKKKALWNIFGFENLKKNGVKSIKMFCEQKFMIMKWRYAYKTNSSKTVSMMSIKHVGEFVNTSKIHYRRMKSENLM